MRKFNWDALTIWEIRTFNFLSGSTFNYIHVKMIGKKIDFHFFPSSE